MKKLLLFTALVIFIPMLALAQTQESVQVNAVGIAPTIGTSCPAQSPLIKVNGSSAAVYQCVSSLWALVNGTAQVYPASGVAISTGTAWDSSRTPPSGAFVGTTDTQTLSNKSFTTFLSATNCAGVGTSAAPSLVVCAAAPAGAFSCAVTASAGTCVVSSTAVTANSVVLVIENSSEGTRLGVTCNAAPTLPPAVLLASKAVGSFTINLATISTNPACFDYWVIN